MIQIDVQQLPNQEFEKEIDGKRYTIKLRTFHGITLADITIDDTVVKRAIRVCPNVPIIPYKYLTQGGNFVFYSIDGSYPHYTQFGITQQLVYMTDEELQELQQDEE